MKVWLNWSNAIRSEKKNIRKNIRNDKKNKTKKKEFEEREANRNEEFKRDMEYALRWSQIMFKQALNTRNVSIFDTIQLMKGFN
jgi:hypothetical protein